MYVPKRLQTKHFSQGPSLAWKKALNGFIGSDGMFHMELIPVKEAYTSGVQNWLPLQASENGLVKAPRDKQSHEGRLKIDENSIRAEQGIPQKIYYSRNSYHMIFN